jgi:hypothetical protein
MPENQDAGRFVGIDIEPSMQESPDELLAFEFETSLRANELKPKLLYVTPRQTELWRQVFLKHSPIHGNPEFARIYNEAFARVAEIAPMRGWLVGLGCGTGLKERELCVRLKERGKEVLASAIDVSLDLVVQSTEAMARAGARAMGSLVCDLAHVEYLVRWLDETGVDAPRIFTFFGLVPNFDPTLVTRIFRALLRPGDQMLVSAHLVQVGDGADLSAAMLKVLPQYDNPETLAWLAGALEEWKLEDLVDAPQMKIGEIEGVPAFIGSATWKTSEPFMKWGQRFSPTADKPLRLFHSLRYTPELFEDFLRQKGFRSERLAITACREEAIWSVCSGGL